MTGGVDIPERAGPRAADAPRSLAVIGNFPPQRCGIATFSRHLCDGLARSAPGAEILERRLADVAAPGGADEAIDRNCAASFVQAAARLNAKKVDGVSLQHEFGIFGGPDGAYILGLIENLDAPLVTTLHTVREDLSDNQTAIVRRIIDASDKVVVMAHRGKEILTGSFGVRPDKIEVVAHGVPRPSAVAAADLKARYGWRDRFVMMTFGLLGRGKGIETAIRAMPDIKRRRPDILYVILGATHPNVIRAEGERYRDELRALAAELGVAGAVAFIDEYVSDEQLVDYLSAIDLYIAPYPNERQITSGTLAYAHAFGKPVLSTPFWHAQELLGEGGGALFPFGDAAKLAEEAVRLIEDSARRADLSAKGLAAGAKMAWPEIGRRYLEIFTEIGASRRIMDRKVVAMPHDEKRFERRPPLAHLEALTDDVGILQHAIFNVANRQAGYCLDDNARALLAITSYSKTHGDPAAAGRLEATYASFVQDAFDTKTRRFRNFMTYDRRFIDEEGSDDCQGRTLHALAHAALHSASADRRLWAQWLFEEALPGSDDIISPRAAAHVINALVAALSHAPGRAFYLDRLRIHADRLHRLLCEAASDDWYWFEDSLAYENALIPSALIKAAHLLGDDAMARRAHAALVWLDWVQTAEDGWFRPVGTDSFFVPRSLPSRFDQQPLEAYASVEAYMTAARVFPGEGWAARAMKAREWFDGANDLGKRLYDRATGACYDGLHPDRVNRNQGAESCLAALLAYLIPADIAAPASQRAGAQLTKFAS